MSKPSKPRPLSVEQLVQRLQEDNAELARQRDHHKQQAVGLMQQMVINCAMGIYIRHIDSNAFSNIAKPVLDLKHADLARHSLDASLVFCRTADEYLQNIDEVKEQFAKNDVADKPADSTAH